MIQQLLPGPVSVCETFGDRTDVPLFPEEETVVARAVPARRAEFMTGRACARDALAALGVRAVAVPRGPHGEPCWPDGMVGSITHCRGYRAAAVARASEVTAVGLDAEPNEHLPDGVLSLIARPEECAWLEAAGRSRDVAWDGILFSAKESLYKVWFPLTRKPLDFPDVGITIHEDGRFDARVITSETDPPRWTVQGRWLVSAGLLLTAMLVPRRGDPSRSKLGERWPMVTEL